MSASQPWYLRYFTPEFWSLSRQEYSAERTAREVAYLAGVLGELAPGRQVLDLGCGTGRHAVALAALGFEVAAVDVSAWALERAGDAAEAAGVKLQRFRLDLLDAGEWELPLADAVVCVQSFGWGSDAEQARLLRRVRGRLRTGGLLVLDHSNATAILRNFAAEARFEDGGVVYEFERRYDALRGRNLGEARVMHPGGRPSVLPHDIRIYQPPEVARMLEAAGFRIERVDAEFSPGAAVDADTRYVQFVARAAGVRRLAVEDYRRPVQAGQLDLRWAPDEVDYVRADLEAAWAEATAAGHADEPAAGPLWDQARHYAVADPFGGHRAAPALSEHFGCTIEPDRVVAGAGTTGLLHALATLVGGGTLLAEPTTHPDLAAWASRAGANFRLADLTGDPEAAAELVAAERPAMVLLDRPGIEGTICDLATVSRLAEAAASAGALLVVDEACATYAGPSASAVPTTARLDNLVVLRSMSKGYCCGGLRVGFAVVSRRAAESVRAAAPPLATAELSLRFAIALLRRGDPLARLRARIAEAKPAAAELLESIGLRVRPGDPRLPWVLADGGAQPEAALERHGIAAKRLDLTAMAAPGRPGVLLKLAVPLSAERERALRSAIGRR
jgi:histidinol-phosphate/aromatic aminotransferase/cobyric acid decarboxylase-like protein/SAM-dependent methyltransferase